MTGASFVRTVQQPNNMGGVSMGRTTRRVHHGAARYHTAVDKVARRAERRKKAAEKRVDEVSPKVEAELRAMRLAVQQRLFDELEAAACKV